MKRWRRRLHVALLALVGAVGLVLVGQIGATAAVTAPAAAAPSIPYPVCFGKAPVLHAQVSGHIAYECLGLGAAPLEGVGLYWSDNLYELNYYWHPGHGQIVVNETFFKSCYEVQLERHGAACGLYGNVPVGDNNPGQNHWADGRFIIMADGCVVAAPTDTGAVPTQCALIMQGGGAIISPGRAMNATELLSAKGFWAIMERYTPDNYW